MTAARDGREVGPTAASGPRVTGGQARGRQIAAKAALWRSAARSVLSDVEASQDRWTRQGLAMAVITALAELCNSGKLDLWAADLPFETSVEEWLRLVAEPSGWSAGRGRNRADRKNPDSAK